MQAGNLMPGNPVCLTTAGAEWKTTEPEEAYSRDEGIQVSFNITWYAVKDNITWYEV